MVSYYFVSDCSGSVIWFDFILFLKKLDSKRRFLEELWQLNG